MSKELEYIQRQIDIVKQQVKGSNIKIIVTDTVTKHKYDYYENELQTLESIEQALQRLESIDNSNPSEALECVDKILGYFGKAQIETMTLSKCDVLTIKQALLKAQKEHKALDLLMQELDCKDFADLRKYARCGYEKMNEKLIQ